MLYIYIYIYIYIVLSTLNVTRHPDLWQQLHSFLLKPVKLDARLADLNIFIISRVYCS